MIPPPESASLDAVLAAVRSEPRARALALVGGAVRDRLMLGRWDQGTDLDLVVEGDAPAVARRLDGPVVIHPAFGTATWRSPEGDVDLVSARTERYPHPGALPVVRAAPLDDDLRRRDFTIHAMAVRIHPGPMGALLDPLSGRRDLDRGWLRALHPRSFVDDPTRLLRAARYAVRLGFELEPRTATWLRAAEVGTVTAERWQGEWRRLLEEPDPGAVLRWLEQEGLASALGLRAVEGLEGFRPLQDGWLGALAVAGGDDPAPLPAGLRARYEALRAPAPPMDGDDLTLEGEVGRLTPLRRAVLAARWPALAPRLERGAALGEEAPLLTGRDLLERGMTPSPRVGEALRRVREAQRLEGITSREEALVLLRREGFVPCA